MLSQKLLLRIFSIVSEPIVVSDGFGAMVGGNVEISATGPISLSNWNSFMYSCCPYPDMCCPKLPLAGVRDPPCWPSLLCSLSGEGCFSSLEGAGSNFAEIRARRKPLYKAGVCREFAARFSRVSATSLTRSTTLCSLSRKGWNSTRTS